MRLFSTGLDICFCGAPLALIPNYLATNLVTILCLMTAYYVGSECWLGRTPGKLLCRFYMLKPGREEIPEKWKFLARTGLRAFLGPLCLLSWNRVTLLDALTAMRVYSVASPAAKIKRAMQGLPQPLGWR